MKKKKFNITKFLRLFLICLIIIPCIFTFSACKSKEAVYVVSIEKTKTDGLKDTYTITYSDGSTSEIVITNGKDGKDGEDGKDGIDGINGKDAENVNTYEMWKNAVEKENYTGSYFDFIKDNFIVSSDISVATAENCLSSVVSVNSTTSSLFGTSKSGSGVIYSLDEDGNALIITNFHVACSGFTPYPNYTLSLGGNSSANTFSATYVGGSSKYDIAVLKVTESEFLKKSNAKPVTFDTSETSVGKKVLAIGNTKNFGISVTKGIVSVPSEQVSMTIANQTANRRLIRHDAYIYEGNSGGGLFDMNGNLIGITNGGDKTAPLMNYAIPASAVKAVVENIIENSSKNNTEVLVCNLGIKIDESNTIESIEVGEVLKNQVLTCGDVITSVTITPKADEPVTKTITKKHEFDEFLLTVRAGDTITITVKRNGLTVTDTIVVSSSNLVALAIK